jgi:nucleoside-diphosphate-sugar epimerase
VLAPTLRDAGHDVVGVDAFFYRGCDFGRDTATIPSIEADVRDLGPAELEGFDAIVHLAALSNDPIGDLNPRLTYDINLDASVALAEAARQAGVRRFVFASSCSMYGAADGDALLDEGALLRPLTPYAESKVRAEQAIGELAGAGFAPVFMRNATVYGVSPRLRLDVVLNNLVAWAHTTGAVRLLSDGSSWRPLVHVRDLARATLVVLEAPLDLVAGQAFNIGSAEQNYRIGELAEIVHRRLPACEVTFAEEASPDPRSYRVDFSKFATVFPTCRFEWTAERGVDELVRAYEEIGLTYEEFETTGRYTRLAQIRRLLDAGAVDEDLRWRTRTAAS